ncbi:MAG: lysophospholipid acyltransferase family protein [Deltaproteobacteria bacterium]|nr:lysophospholipid acyltransferase family protein [Deltaproteobacteria bacterium]
MASRILKSGLGTAVAHRSISAAARGTLKTVRLLVEGEEAMLSAAGETPPVFAFWHGKQMLLLRYRLRWPLGILVSHSRDGELLARVLSDFGHRITRGSSSKGGAEGLAGLAELYRQGCAPCFAADGPRGPYHVLKPGAVRLASELGRPLVPASAAAGRRLTLGSWDRLELVAPFSIAAVVFGPAFAFPRGMDEDAVRMATEKVGRAVDACTRRAEEMIAEGKGCRA